MFHRDFEEKIIFKPSPFLIFEFCLIILLVCLVEVFVWFVLDLVWFGLAFVSFVLVLYLIWFAPGHILEISSVPALGSLPCSFPSVHRK